MTNRMNGKGRFSILLALSFLLGCTENPFLEEEEVSSRAIVGTVKLKDGWNPEGIHVWLEGLDVWTRTDENGDFRLDLPPPGSEGTGEGVNEDFYLYYYVANYRLDSSKVVILNGEVARSAGDINDKGELKEVKYLYRILDVHTDISPDGIPEDYKRGVTITVSLTATSGPLFVKSFKRVQNSVLKRTGFIILDADGNFERAMHLGRWWRRAAEIVPDGGKVWEIKFLWSACDLPKGTYGIIPYLLVLQDGIPAGLIESLGPEATELGPGYLRMPFKRDEGTLVVF